MGKLLLCSLNIGNDVQCKGKDKAVGKMVVVTTRIMWVCISSADGLMCQLCADVLIECWSVLIGF